MLLPDTRKIDFVIDGKNHQTTKQFRLVTIKIVLGMHLISREDVNDLVECTFAFKSHVVFRNIFRDRCIVHISAISQKGKSSKYYMWYWGIDFSNSSSDFLYNNGTKRSALGNCWCSSRLNVPTKFGKSGKLPEKWHWVFTQTIKSLLRCRQGHCKTKIPLSNIRKTTACSRSNQTKHWG